jgi:hypothetical protein
MSKPIHRSKTININVLAAALLSAEANFNLLQPHVQVNVYAVASFGLAIVNVVLRFYTTQPLQGESNGNS